MAQLAQPMSQVEMANLSGRRFRLTRTLFFSVVFIVLGAFLLWYAPANVADGVFTRLTFGRGVPDLPVPALDFALFVGASYLLGGLFGIAPLPERYSPVKVGWLGVNGVLIILVILIITSAGSSLNMTQTIQSSFRLMTPIAMGALAGIWCERSGVVNIAIEGMMLTGACMGFVAVTLIAPYFASQQTALWVSVGFATISGGLMALLHAWLSITFRTDQIVSGTVINILALGITSFLRREVLLSTEAARETLNVVRIPILSEIPVLGDVFFTGKPIFLMMFVLIVVTHVMLYYTRWGLRTRAVGENPHAADTLGVNVIANRYINVIIGGLIAGLAGAWFSLEFVGTFEDNMIGGLGFIALAAMIFGKWTPFGAAFGALLFGFSQTLNLRFQIAGVAIPPQLIQMTPYLLTVIVLAGLVGRATAPKADGVPYKKE